LLVVSACGSPKRGAAPSASRPEPGRIAAYGVATGIRDHALARNTAENRAISALHKLLEPEAVEFEYRAVGPDSTLKTVVPSGKVAHTATELIPVAGGWGARAYGVRSPEALAAIEALPSVTAEVTVKHADAGVALTIAESRAIRSIIAQATHTCTESCKVGGTLTLASYEPEFLEDGVTLELTGHAKPGRAAALKKKERRLVGRLAAEEHFELQEWQALLETLDRIQKLSSRDAGLCAMRGEAEAGLGRLDAAIEAFAKAEKLDRKNAAYRTRREALQKELEAKQKAAAAAATEPARAGSGSAAER
jgi:tetratricopeptide (TPR) repeat protein